MISVHGGMTAHPVYDALAAGAARELAAARPAQGSTLDQLELRMDAESSGCRTPEEWTEYYEKKCPTPELLEAEVQSLERVLGHSSLFLRDRASDENRLRQAKRALALRRRSSSWLQTVSRTPPSLRWLLFALLLSAEHPPDARACLVLSVHPAPPAPGKAQPGRGPAGGERGAAAGGCGLAPQGRLS